MISVDMHSIVYDLFSFFLSKVEPSCDETDEFPPSFSIAVSVVSLSSKI